jgi:hypothetical protein
MRTFTMRRKDLRAFILLGGSLLGLGCGAPSGGTDAGVDPLLVCDTAAAAVLTPKIHADVVSARCVTCHAPPPAAAAMRGEWETVTKFQDNAVGKGSFYAGMQATLKIVDPGRPENSALMLKVLGGGMAFHGPNGEGVGGPMPASGAALSSELKKELRDWICQGAKAQ